MGAEGTSLQLDWGREAGGGGGGGGGEILVGGLGGSCEEKRSTVITNNKPRSRLCPQIAFHTMACFFSNRRTP